MGGAAPAFAGSHSGVRAEIMKIPGVGMGSPGDPEWQKVGELCMGPVKERVAEGEFKGVELTFMGLNNQNLHNFLFRGFLKPWEAYTGAKINWIDLAQADYNRDFSSLLRQKLLILISLKWGLHSKVILRAKAFLMKCLTG